MRIRRRWIAAGLVFAAAAVPAVVGLALTHQPSFYARALGVGHSELVRGSDSLLERAAGLVSDTQEEGAWQALFTADEINGWLAVDVPRNHPALLPAQVRDPRVRVEGGEVHLAYRFGHSRLAPVISVRLGAFVGEPGRLTLRLRSVRAGAVPLPLAGIIDELTRWATDSEVPLRWTHIDGDPVAVIHLPSRLEGNSVRIEALDLGDGDIYIAGRTEKLDDYEPDETFQPPSAEMATQPPADADSNEQIQR